MGIDIKRLRFVGNVSETSKSGKMVCAIYASPKKHYIAEVVPATKFEFYYLYPVSKEKLLSYITNKKMKHALPVSGQTAYKVRFKEILEVMEIMDSSKIPVSHLTCNDSEFQCEDYYNIIKHLTSNKKKK